MRMNRRTGTILTSMFPIAKVLDYPIVPYSMHSSGFNETWPSMRAYLLKLASEPLFLWPGREGEGGRGGRDSEKKEGGER